MIKLKLHICRYTEEAALSGKKTITGRTSGETVKAPKGQVHHEMWE